MKGKEFISSRQFFFIVVGYITGASYILISALQYIKKDIFIADFFAIFFAVILMLMMSYIIKAFPYGDIKEVLESILGKTVSWIFFLCFFIISFTIGCINEYLITNFISSMVALSVPEWIIQILINLSITAILYYGFEATARAIECLYPLLLIGIVILYFMIGFSLFDYKSLLPLFTEKSSNLIKASIASYWSPFSSIAIMIFVFPLIKDSKAIIKASLQGILTASLLFVFEGILVISAFGGTHAQKLAFPFYEVVRLISIGNYFERLGIIAVLIWFFGAFTKLSVLNFACAKSLQHLFGLKDYKSLVFPVALLWIPVGLKTVNDLGDSKILSYVFIPTIMIPLTLLIAAIFVGAVIKKYSNKGKNFGK